MVVPYLSQRQQKNPTKEVKTKGSPKGDNWPKSQEINGNPNANKAKELELLKRVEKHEITNCRHRVRKKEKGNGRCREVGVGTPPLGEPVAGAALSWFLYPVYRNGIVMGPWSDPEWGTSRASTHLPPCH